MKKNLDIHTPRNDISAFHHNLDDFTANKQTLPKPVENVESNNSRKNSVVFGLSDHHHSAMNLVSSPSKSNASMTSKEDSIQNIQIIDDYSHSLPFRSRETNECKSDAVQDPSSYDINDVHKFLTTPVPKNKVIETYIVRNKSGISNRLYPSYCVYLKDTKHFLMFAKKRQKNRTSNYIITTDKNNSDDKNAKSYLGKVRGNFVGTEFVIYDNGRSPRDEADSVHRGQGAKHVRSELAAALYETNILGTKGPRKMTILLPKLNQRPTATSPPPPIGTSTASSSGHSTSSVLTHRYKQNLMSLLLVLQNKSPKWNEHIGAYVLNFNGRVTMASVKNFQLVFPNKTDHQNDIILQFGRVGKDRFTMDLKHPLTPLQAFGICLTSFDNKLACE